MTAVDAFMEEMVADMAQGAVYRTSPTKRSRRTKAEIETIKTAIQEVLADENPMTVRQVFYRLVSLGVIDKTEAEYKTTVCRLLTDMRRNGDVLYSWIADNTRWMRKPETYSNLEQAVQETARFLDAGRPRPQVRPPISSRRLAAHSWPRAAERRNQRMASSRSRSTPQPFSYIWPMLHSA